MDVRVTIPCIYSADSTGHDRNCPQNSAIAEDLLVSEHNRYRYIFCVPFFGSPFRGDKPFAAIAKPHLCNSSSRTRQSRCLFSLHAEKKELPPCLKHYFPAKSTFGTQTAFIQQVEFAVLMMSVIIDWVTVPQFHRRCNVGNLFTCL